MDSDAFESQQMIKEEPRVQQQIEPQPQSESQPEPMAAQEDQMRYEKQVDRIEPSMQEPQPILQRYSKRAKANTEIREVAPEGKSDSRALGQNFESMKKKVKQKRGRKVAEEEMPPVAPRIVPYNQAQSQAKKTDPQEESLQKLVHELEFGTLDKSIKVLRDLIASYPDDSDYKKLYDMALSLKDADTWYSYQRNTPSPSMNGGGGDEEKPKPQPKPIPQIQASSDNPRVNELKRSSWLLIKNNYRKN